MATSNIRAKFLCQAKTERLQNGNDDECHVEVELWPVYGPDGENAIFGKYTPSGRITMTLKSRSAAEAFQLGQAYYVDFTPAPSP